MKLYGIQYTSAVTRNQVHTTCATKAQATREAAALVREGAKNIIIYEVK